MFRRIALWATAGVFATVIGVAGVTEAQASNSKACIDGFTSSNIKSKWSGTDTITVSTKSNRAVCKDTTLFFSGFIMPDTWDGNGWNKTAVPQTHYVSTSGTFKAGKNNQKLVMKLDLDECKHMQVDLYYAPKQAKITWTDKIGERMITAKHVKATKCEPPVKDIKVCDLSSKKITTIKETELNGGLHSRSLDDCRVVIKDIEVCDLISQEVVVVKEDTISAEKHSRDLSDCDPMVEEEPETPEAPEEPVGAGEVDGPEVPAELPRTGLTTNILTVLLAAFGTYATAYRLRR